MVEFSVQGMSCGHCVGAIKEAVRHVDPGAETNVDLARGIVSIASDADADRFRQTIEAAGYLIAPKTA